MLLGVLLFFDSGLLAIGTSSWRAARGGASCCRRARGPRSASVLRRQAPRPSPPPRRQHPLPPRVSFHYRVAVSINQARPAPPHDRASTPPLRGASPRLKSHSAPRRVDRTHSPPPPVSTLALGALSSSSTPSSGGRRRGASSCSSWASRSCSPSAPSSGWSSRRSGWWRSLGACCPSSFHSSAQCPSSGPSLRHPPSRTSSVRSRAPARGDRPFDPAGERGVGGRRSPVLGPRRTAHGGGGSDKRCRGPWRARTRPQPLFGHCRWRPRGSGIGATWLPGPAPSRPGPEQPAAAGGLARLPSG